MCRSDTLTLSLPARRSTEPEIFTFDRIPAPVAPQAAPCARPRARRVRVLYPSTGRRYLPAPERSPAKRLLLGLVLVLLLQIYSEDDVTAGELAAAREASFTGHCGGGSTGTGTTEARTLANMWSWWLEKTCPAPSSQVPTTGHGPAPAPEPAVSERSHGYVVALLYPVYHTISNEQ